MMRGNASVRVDRRAALLLRCLASATNISLWAFQGARPVNIGNPSTVEDFRAGDANRENQRATNVVDALRLTTGNWAADDGAGGGYYSMRIADKVGRCSPKYE